MFTTCDACETLKENCKYDINLTHFVFKYFSFVSLFIFNYRRDLILKNPTSNKAVSTDTMIASSNTVGLSANKC